MRRTTRTRGEERRSGYDTQEAPQNVGGPKKARRWIEELSSLMPFYSTVAAAPFGARLTPSLSLLLLLLLPLGLTERSSNERTTAAAASEATGGHAVPLTVAELRARIDVRARTGGLLL